MIKDIKLSLITVTYNCDKSLQRTIDSIFTQDYSNIEYIIVDGKSTDATLDIIKSNVERFDGRLSYVSEKDNGLYDAMNKGIKLATGEVIGIINGDDYYESNIFSKIVNIFSDESIDIIYSDLLFIRGGKLDFDHKLIANHNNLNKRMSVNHPTCFVRRRCYEKYGFFDLEYKIAADYEIMVRFYMEGCKFQKSNSVLAVMEMGGLSSNNKNSISEKYKIHKKYFGKVHANIYRVKNIILYYFRKTKRSYGVMK